MSSWLQQAQFGLFLFVGYFQCVTQPEIPLLVLSFEKFSKKPNAEVLLVNIIMFYHGLKELKKSILRAQCKSTLQKDGKCQILRKGSDCKSRMTEKQRSNRTFIYHENPVGETLTTWLCPTLVYICQILEKKKLGV